LEVIAPKNYSEMVTVQSGTLPMGSELAGQTVATFQIGKTEVTWGEWKEVRDWAVANGYTDLAGMGDTYPSGSADNFPVVNVSWYDAVKWCNAHSEREGLTPVYQASGVTYKTGQIAPTQSTLANGFRLPSDKEWEWAARGGVSSQGYTYSGGNDVNAVAWYSGNSNSGTKAEGTKAANELGIYDMSGNAWEWCWDVHDPYPSLRHISGGGWTGAEKFCRVAFRLNFNPDSRFNYLGFRMARSSGNL
jgi:formylglycine-generating enzyme required for sulfatase activity